MTEPDAFPPERGLGRIDYSQAPTAVYYIARVWRAAAEELEQAHQIMIAGYSLPESDGFFRYLFALGVDSATLLRRIVIINPDDSKAYRNRVRRLLGRGVSERIEFIERERSYFRYMPSLLENELKDLL